MDGVSSARHVRYATMEARADDDDDDDVDEDSGGDDDRY